MNRIVHVRKREGEKAAGIVNVSTFTEDNTIFLQVTKESAPAESVYINLDNDEAREIADALMFALSTKESDSQP